MDNCSTDDTASVVESFTDRLPLQYLFEPQQGKVHALNQSIACSQGALLLFTDDDVRVDVGWMEAMWEGAQAHPDAGFFGGQVLPSWECNRPQWFDPNRIPTLRDVIVWQEGGKETYPYNENMVPVGANIGFRRWVFEKVGMFRHDLGPRGQGGVRGEETELCRRLVRAGIEGFYVPRSIIYHPVPPERCTKHYIWDYHVNYGRAQVRINGTPSNRRLVWLPIRLARITAHALAAAVATLRRHETEQVYHLTRMGFNWGQALEAWSSRRRATAATPQSLESPS